MAYQTAKVHAIANRLRRQGYSVGLRSGWETRGGSDFNPAMMLWHHTASAAGSLGLGFVANNNLANFFLPRDNWRSRHGDVVMVAAGTAFHGGLGSWRGVRGNNRLWGCEADNNGIGEVWSPRMIEVYHDLGAAVADVTPFDPRYWIAQHWEYAANRPGWPGRKIDCWGPPIARASWPGQARRDEVWRRLNREPVPKPTPKPLAPLDHPGVRMLMEDDMMVFRLKDSKGWVLVRPGPGGWYCGFPGGYGSPVARAFGGAGNIPEATTDEIKKLAGDAAGPVSWRGDDPDATNLMRHEHGPTGSEKPVGNLLWDAAVNAGQLNGNARLRALRHSEAKELVREVLAEVLK